MAISVSLLRGLVAYVVETGVAESELLERAGCPADALQNPNARVSADVQDRMFEAALTLTGDPAFGLHMGERVPIGAFGVTGYMCWHARSVREALEVLLRYQRILADCPPSSVTWEGQRATLVYNYVRTNALSNRIRTEYGLGLICRIWRALQGPELALEEVRFEHAAPEYVAEYERIFGVPVVFESGHSGLVGSIAESEKPPLFANPELFAALRARAEAELAAAREPETYRERVHDLIVNHYNEVEPTMDAVARRLRTSERSLRRKLVAEGVSFRAVADAALAQLAKAIVAEPHTTIQDAAYRLGFAEPSSFNRAFKRLTGMSPSEYRASLRK